MIFVDINGKERKLKSPYKYAIDWSGGSRSKIQEKVKKCLEPIWGGMAVYEEFPVLGSKMTLDFFNYTLNIAIEVQGNQHLKYIKFFHLDNKLNFHDQLFRDKQKRAFCSTNGIKLVEVFEKDKISTHFLQNIL